MAYGKFTASRVSARKLRAISPESKPNVSTLGGQTSKKDYWHFCQSWCSSASILLCTTRLDIHIESILLAQPAGLILSLYGNYQALGSLCIHWGPAAQVCCTCP